MTLGECRAALTRSLYAVCRESAAFEARELIKLALKISDSEIFCMQNRMLGENEWKTVELLLKRRLNHEPLQYILGEWEFMGLPFWVNEHVLIPRQDTETLAEAAISAVKANGYKSLLDICTGTGCVGIAIGKLCGIDVCLSDISSECIGMAKKNARLNSVNACTIKSDMFCGIHGSYDIITANPPYIRSGDLPSLSHEVRREPMLALDGGVSGLDFYRRIAAEYACHLNKGGMLLLELGARQAEDVSRLFSADAKLRLICDLNGHNRVLEVVPKG